MITAPEPAGPTPGRVVRPTRRAVLAGVGGLALGIGVTAAAPGRVADGPAASAVMPAEAAVPAYGPTQAGIDRPGTPQPFGLVTVVDLEDPADLSFLPDLGRRLAALTGEGVTDLLPDGPQQLTVTIGLGPRVVAARRQTGPGRQALPAFRGDERIAPLANGGDLLVAAYGGDPTVLAPVVDRLTSLVPRYRPRWVQRCFRGPGRGGDGTIVRNPLGFHDNVQIPRTAGDLAADVWLDGPLAGGTICVLRRLQLAADRFRALPTARREQIVGRRLDGTPLSGGRPFDAVDIDAKTAAGDYLIPAHAHVRAAHPSFTGSALMLRRGYAYDNGDGDAGLLFTSFQRDLRTFVLTQRRLDDLDDLMAFATPTASATFLILPGFTDQTPLGAIVL